MSAAAPTTSNVADQKAVFEWFLRHQDAEGRVSVGTRTLAAALGISRRRTIAAVDRLVQIGLLAREHTTLAWSGGTGPMRYTITLPESYRKANESE